MALKQRYCCLEVNALLLEIPRTYPSLKKEKGCTPKRLVPNIFNFLKRYNFQPNI